jgi:iron(III) transport system substrate-binding protein
MKPCQRKEERTMQTHSKSLLATTSALGLVAFLAMPAHATEAFSLEALIEAAKAEAPITVYSSTGKIVGQVESFVAEFDVPATGVKVSTDSQVELVIREYEANNVRGDVILLGDVPSGVLELLPRGYVESWVPTDLADKIPAHFHDPFVVSNDGTVFAYNTSIEENCPIDNIWALTEEEWRGRLALQDPLGRAALLDWFNQMETHMDDAVATAYEAYFGAPLQTEEQSATAAWVAALAANGPLLTDSDQGISDAVGTPGQATSFVGIISSAKFRDNAERGYALGLCAGVAPVSGYMTPTLAVINARTQSPNAARLMVRYLATPEGMAPQMIDGKMPTNVDAVLPADEPSGIGAVLDQIYPFDAATAAQDWGARQDWQDIWRIHYRR